MLLVSFEFDDLCKEKSTYFAPLGLLGSDIMRIIIGNHDWAQSIAEELGYYVDFGPASMKHT